MTKDTILKAFGEAVLNLIRYSLVILAILYALNYTYQTRELAINANRALNEYIKNGWLPDFPLSPKPK
jgi:hypothetical protein